MTTKINITSTAVEKGIDLAKDFLGVLIKPAVEETGLLIKDQVTLWRFKNQVKMLNKAQSIVEKQNINPKKVSLKVLVPLLEYSSLEEDDEIQDTWAILLSNIVDSEQNIENHVFPYILGQISLQELSIIKKAWSIKSERIRLAKKDLEAFEKEFGERLKELNKEVPKLREQYYKPLKSTEDEKLERKKFFNASSEFRKLSAKKRNILEKIIGLEEVKSDDLEIFEIHNLIRLGVLKMEVLSYGTVSSIRGAVDRYDDSVAIDDVDVTIEKDCEEYYLTELGEKFIQACIEKNCE